MNELYDFIKRFAEYEFGKSEDETDAEWHERLDEVISNMTSEARWLTRPTIRLTRRELATVLAALRLWQSTSAGEFADIATDLGQLEPLDNNEVDLLCEHINTGVRITIEPSGSGSMVKVWK